MFGARADMFMSAGKLCSRDRSPAFFPWCLFHCDRSSFPTNWCSVLNLHTGRISYLLHEWSGSARNSKMAFLISSSFEKCSSGEAYCSRNTQNNQNAPETIADCAISQFPCPSEKPYSLQLTQYGFTLVAAIKQAP